MHFLITNNYNLRFSKYLSGMIQRKSSVLKAECWVCSTYVGWKAEGGPRPSGTEETCLKRTLLFLRLLRHSLARQTRLASALWESSCRCLQGTGITDNYQDVQHHRRDQTSKNCWGDEMTQQLWETGGFSEKQTVMWSGNSSSGTWELLPPPEITIQKLKGGAL